MQCYYCKKEFFNHPVMARLVEPNGIACCSMDCANWAEESNSAMWAHAHHQGFLSQLKVAAKFGNLSEIAEAISVATHNGIEWLEVVDSLLL